MEEKRDVFTCQWSNLLGCCSENAQHHCGKLPVHCSRERERHLTVCLRLPIERKAYKARFYRLDRYTQKVLFCAAALCYTKPGIGGRSCGVQFLRNVPANYNGAARLSLAFFLTSPVPCVVITTSRQSIKAFALQRDVFSPFRLG